MNLKQLRISKWLSLKDVSDNFFVHDERYKDNKRFFAFYSISKWENGVVSIKPEIEKKLREFYAQSEKQWGHKLLGVANNRDYWDKKKKKSRKK